MTDTFFTRAGWFVFLLLLQVLVFNHIHILGYVTPLTLPYLALRFPGTASRSGLLLWCFSLGFVADTFTNTPGMAAASMTLLAFVQPALLKLFSSRDNEEDMLPTARAMGWGAYSCYALLGVLLFEVCFYILEAFSFFNWEDLLIHIGGGTVLTTLFILAFEGIRGSGK